MIERFWLFHCGYARIPRFAVIEDGGWEWIRLPFLAGLAEHSEYGPVIVDAPFGHEGPANLGMAMGSFMQLAGLEFEVRWSIVARVEQLGFRPADVRHILMTHLHYDHTGGMKSLAHAQFHVSSREWDYATDGSLGGLAKSAYTQLDYRSLDKHTLRHDDVPHLADSQKGLDVLGDGSVEMFSLPGHSPGHCGYRIHLASGPAVFFAGDVAFTVDQIYEREGLGFFPRNVATSKGGIEVSLRALRRHLGAQDDRVITSHDIELGRRCIEEGPQLYGEG